MATNLLYEDDLSSEVVYLIAAGSSIIFTSLINNGLIDSQIINKSLDKILNNRQNPYVFFSDHMIPIFDQMIQLGVDQSKLKKIIKKNLDNYYSIYSKDLAQMLFKKLIARDYPQLISSSFLIFMNDLEFFEEYLFDWFNNLPMDKIENNSMLKYVNPLNLIKMMNRSNRYMNKSFLQIVIHNDIKPEPLKENQEIYNDFFKLHSVNDIKSSIFDLTEPRQLACWIQILLDILNIDVEFTFNESLVIFYCLARCGKLSTTKWHFLHTDVQKYIELYIDKRAPICPISNVTIAFKCTDDNDAFQETYFYKELTRYLQLLDQHENDQSI